MPTKLSNLRNTISNFARAYKYTFTVVIQNPNSALKALLTQEVQNMLTFSCVNVPVPSKGVQEITVEVGPNTMREPGRKEFGGTISPEFLMQGNYAIYKFFHAWKVLATSDNGTHENPSQFHGQVIIKTLDPKDQVSLVKIYENLWCRNLPEIQFSDDQNEIVRFQPELVYEFDRTQDANGVDL